jgi:hypothetical protein
VFLVVPSGSDAGHELDASSVGIAEETLLAGIEPIQRPASAPPTAVRAGEGEVVNLRHLIRGHGKADALPVLQKGGIRRQRRSSHSVPAL